jgi:hypothetical protein
MANQNAIQDDNQFPALTGHTGTAGTAETRRIVVNSKGGIDVSPSGLITSPYDTVTVAYPNGTTEVYSFYDGGTAGTDAGTITLNYLDLNKGTLLSAIKTGG